MPSVADVIVQVSIRKVAVIEVAPPTGVPFDVDCDRRVMLGGDVDTRTYAELLLAVGTRRSSPAYAIGFSLGRPFLEQRIDRMTLPVGRSRWPRNLALALGICATLIMAWGLPHPVRAATVDSAWNACPGGLLRHQPEAPRRLAADALGDSVRDGHPTIPRAEIACRLTMTLYLGTE